MVEFALVGPIFLLMLFGTIELGRALWTNHELANGTREGARYAMVHGSLAITPATVADVRQEVLDHSSGLQDARLDVDVPVGLGGEPGEILVVESTYQFDFILSFLPGPDTIELEHRSEVIIQH
jgi:hypothetical protein